MQPAASERSVISPCGSGILSSIALAPISFRVTERESHLLHHQRSTLDSRVYECGFEGTVAVADQLLHLSRSSMMRRSWSFFPSSRYLPVRIFYRAHLRKRLGDMNLY